MQYSVEEIYKYSGQFDKTVLLSFSTNSEAYCRYGEYVVGVIHYTISERQKLQESIEKEELTRSNGYIKIKVSYSEKLNNVQRYELLNQGIVSSDIIEILRYDEPLENQFKKTDLRRLPEPIEIKVDFSGTDEEDIFLWLCFQKLKTGYKLIPKEKAKYNGILLRKIERQEINNKFKLIEDSENKVFDKEVRYEYLKSKFLKDQLVNEEKEEFDNFLKNIAKDRSKIFINELQKSSEQFKKVGINYKGELRTLFNITILFESETLNHGRFPVW